MLCLCPPAASLSRLLGRRDKAGDQLSPEFEREGDTWRLRLTFEDGRVGLYLQLISGDKPAEYSVECCFSFRVLHPTDAAHSVWKPDSGFRGPLPYARGEWGVGCMLDAASLDAFMHNGHVTLQVLVWAPTAEESAAAANDPRYLQLLRNSFNVTPEAVIQRVIAQQGGNVGRAFAELLRWSPEELKQSTIDEQGREIFTWRVPLAQCQSTQCRA